MGCGLTGDAFRARLRALDISQRRFAALAGVTTNTVSRWRTGALPVPLWVERLLDAWDVAGVPDANRDAG